MKMLAIIVIIAACAVPAAKMIMKYMDEN